MTAVHQLVPVLNPGDAIGAATLRTREILRGLGYVSDIFVEAADRRLAGATRSATELDRSVDTHDAVIYRLAIGSHLARAFERVSARRILIYHNITPVAYYVGANPEVAYWLERGRQDLRRLAPVCDLVIADSSFNLAEAAALGAHRAVVIPPAIDLSRLSPRPAHGSQPPVALFVGRVAPNKRHDVLLRSLAALRATSALDARIVMVGAAADTERYLDRLKVFAASLGVADSLTLDGRHHTDAQLGDHYYNANVFVTASEHEGFCVPAVEAMAFSLPVIAYAAGAVPETVAGAGLLLHSHDPLLWAAAIERVLTDATLQCALVEAGRVRVQDFSEERYRERLAAALASLGLAP